MMTGADILRAEGEAKGEAKGKAKGKAEGILRVLAARKRDVSEGQRALILATTDLNLLDTWLERAVTCATTDDIFKD